MLLPGFLNDIFQFDTTSLKWTELSRFILGSTPAARYGHAMAITDDFLYLCGGIIISGEEIIWAPKF